MKFKFALFVSILALSALAFQSPASAAAPFHSTTLQEFAPVQTTGGDDDAFFQIAPFAAPSELTRKVAFAGVPGKPAHHEGVDFVHSDPAQPHVGVFAVADGVVAYVRTGCPQSAMFTRNTALREAGAGWGNHVVVLHGEFVNPMNGVKYGFYTRYAHLAPGTVTLAPGAVVKKGDCLGEMGNSGRSELRHLHFEAGIKKDGFVTDKPSQSFDLVFDPARFMPRDYVMGELMEPHRRKNGYSR